MKQNYEKYSRPFFVIVLLAFFMGDLSAQDEPTWIAADLEDTDLVITGSGYTSRYKDSIFFQRFSNQILAMSTSQSKLNPVRAHTTSGIVLAFRTSSPEVRLEFSVEDGENRGHKYGIYQDSVLSKEFYFSKTDGPELVMELATQHPGDTVLYEITLPNWSITALRGIYLHEGFTLEDYTPAAQPVYLAYGNSITHGTGQNGTHKTYPFLLSRELEMTLWNAAVGGSKTSVEVAQMLRDDFGHIDYMTVLIGYNDFNNEGVSVAEYSNRYTSFLRTFREGHPETQIFCITLLATTSTISKVTGLPAEDFRKAAIDVVAMLQTEGDTLLHLIHGDSISDLAMLKDAVHLSEEGAADFALNLAEAIKKKTEEDPRPKLEILSEPLDSAVVGQTYEYQLEFTEGAQVSMETIPHQDWLSCGATGLVTGTPPVEDTIQIIIDVTDGYTSARQVFELRIFDPFVAVNRFDVKELSIFPNPSQGHIRIGDLQPGSCLFLYNSLGQELLQIPYVRESMDMDFSHLPCGIYYMVIEGKNCRQNGKFMLY